MASPPTARTVVCHSQSMSRSSSVTQAEGGEHQGHPDVANILEQIDNLFDLTPPSVYTLVNSRDLQIDRLFLGPRWIYAWVSDYRMRPRRVQPVCRRHTDAPPESSARLTPGASGQGGKRLISEDCSRRTGEPGRRRDAVEPPHCRYNSATRSPPCAPLSG
jgi:hypothetical protein